MGRIVMKQAAKFLLVEWINGIPMIDGAKYAETEQELIDYLHSLPKPPKLPNLKVKVEYTICEINAI